MHTVSKGGESSILKKGTQYSHHSWHNSGAHLISRAVVYIPEAEPPPSVMSNVTSLSVSPLTSSTQTNSPSPSTTEYSASSKLSLNSISKTQRLTRFFLHQICVMCLRLLSSIKIKALIGVSRMSTSLWRPAENVSVDSTTLSLETKIVEQLCVAPPGVKVWVSVRLV